VAPLTLMAVHAHPDDESISTGGILARYGAEGVRTVLVTCTDGGCGDGADGSKPGEPGHDRSAVVAERRLELERSSRALGITHLELLGYADSGMMGWPQNDEPGSFWTTPAAEAADRLAELYRRYRPDVVVTYDPNGFYGHPDHIQAHRIAVAAERLTAIPSKLYYTAVPRSAMAEMGRRIRELGIEFPADPAADSASDGATGPASDGAGGPERTGPASDGTGEPERAGPPVEWGTPDEEITTVIDVSDYTAAKFESLTCHASQSDNIFFLKMGRDVFNEMMGREAFVRVSDRTDAPLPESDLFAGLR
jgi:LmbE family N-acetylglucosaminyl deacetylase